MNGEPMAGARAAAAEFVAQLGSNDAACLYVFATQVRQLVDCTTDHAAVITAIEGLQTIDDTALYDALTRVTADHIQRDGRLAIVVLSDGADTKSRATLDEAFRQVRESSIPVYTIGLLSPQFDGTVLQRLSDEADAIYLEAPKVENMAELYRRINEQLLNQYRVSFTSLFPSRREGEILIRIKRNDEAIEITRTFTVQS
ncbi:VWA domain-containing protein [Candidatus Gracilibacteria bacterium]|nr:VWA domain-containing protein [Candidatus Gracilibacteria bacterium]